MKNAELRILFICETECDGSFNVGQVDMCVEAFSGDACQALLHEDSSQLNMAINWNSDCVKACQAPLR